MDETLSSGEVYDAFALLRQISLFQHLDDDTLNALVAELEWFALPGGATLFEFGDESDALYVLQSGSLGAFRPDNDGKFGLEGLVAAGETVGELGLMIDQPRSATVRALRDSELLRLSRNGFKTLMAKDPQAMLDAARISVKRLIERRTTMHLSAPRTFAILPHDDTCGAAALAAQLRDSLSRYGDCALIDEQSADGQTSAWYASLESRFRYVIYLAPARDDGWRALCLRQADCLLFVAEASQAPSPWQQNAELEPERMQHRPRHLLLLHRGGVIKWGSAALWLQQQPGCMQHHHVRDLRDVDRVARLLIGRSIGLVLSGGGARGFAHIGVVRALREAGMQIDRVGGTSIGAIIAAGVAADWTDEEMFENYRRAFVVGKPLRDYTFPFVSLVTGRRVSRLLREEFGARDVTDLALPYFCVTANLTSGAAQSHRSGPLWFWLRASCAIPGVLPPVFHRNEVFVDGAVINNLPVDIMRDCGVGEVVAVDISADDILHASVEEYALPSWWRLLWQRFTRPALRPGILSILLRSGMVNAEAASVERHALTSLLLTPPLEDIELLDWNAYERAIEAGYRHAQQVLGRAAAPRELP